MHGVQGASEEYGDTMSENIYVTVKQLVSNVSVFGQRPMWAVYLVELTPDLEQIVSKSLDVFEYQTFDEDGKEVNLVFDVVEAMGLLDNLTKALEANR